jgi:hypothetical protein
MSIIPLPVPPDPIEGNVGHFEHTLWVKDALLALDAVVAADSAGGVIKGNVIIDPDDDPNASATVRGSGLRALYGQTAEGVNRWGIVVGDTTPETGGDLGSKFSLQAYGDDGALRHTLLNGDRVNGLLTVKGDPTAALGIATKQYADGVVVNSMGGTSTTKAPSQNSVVTALAGKAASSHTHAASDLTSGTINYARLPVGTGSTQVAQGSHTHDDRYFTESEINSKLAGKSDTSHSHAYASTNHNHDSRYYTEAEVQSLLASRPAFKYGRPNTAFPIGSNQSTGDIVIAHGLGRTPYAVFVSADDDGGDCTVYASVRAFDATNIIAHMRNTGSSESHVYINWIAF